MTRDRDNTPLGALYMLGACVLFSLMWVFVKLASAGIPFIEIMLFRNAAALIPTFFIVARAGGLRVLSTAHPSRHLLRAFTGLGAMGTNFFALSVLPLADTTALIYSTPLFVTILSIPLLGERVGVWRWSAVIVGFLGILVIAISQGAFSAQTVGGWLAVAATVAAISHGLFSALTTLLVRQLSATDHSAGIVFWQSVLMTGLCLLMVPFVWVTPTWTELMQLMAVGLIGGIAQYLLTQAYATAEASAIGAYSYSSIIFSAFAGWLLWNDVPELGFYAGGALIVGSGIVILHRERVRRAARGARDIKT